MGGFWGTKNGKEGHDCEENTDITTVPGLARNALNAYAFTFVDEAKSLKMQKTGRNVAKILKNALGKAFGKSKKAKACLADVNQEIISTLSKKIEQSEEDFENGVYKFEKDAREVAIANFEDILSTYFVSSRAVCDRLPNFERNVQKIRKEIEKTCDRKKFCFDFPVEESSGEGWIRARRHNVKPQGYIRSNVLISIRSQIYSSLSSNLLFS